MWFVICRSRRTLAPPAEYGRRESRSRLKARGPWRTLSAVPIVAAIGISLALAGPARAAQAADEQADWEARIASLAPNTVESARTMQALLQLPPDTSFAVLKTALQTNPSAEVRVYLLNMAAEHPRVLDLLDIGARDGSLFVQNRALQALEMYSFASFSEDYSAYDAWHRRQTGRTLEETMRESCREYIASVNGAPENERADRLNLLQRIAYNLSGTANARVRRKAMLESGLPDALAQWAANPNTAWTAFAVIRNLRMDEAYLKRVMLPLIGPNADLNYRRQALGVIASPDNRWAGDLLLKMFVKEYPDAEAESVGYAITQVADPHAIPTLIAMMDADRSIDGQRFLGNLLNVMTGNNTGVQRDAGFWHGWWARNGARFPADVRSQEIPKLAVRPRPMAGPASRGPEQRQIAGDVKRTYWLVTPVRQLRGVVPGAPRDLAPPAPPVGIGIGAAREDEVPGLLVVLPPDGNGASGALFWQDVAQRALHNHYLVAVATAPKWSDSQQDTWVTGEGARRVKEAKFTTAKFAAEIVQDVLASYKVDPSRIFLHGATDSGMAAYACSLDESTPFKGFYLLASPFRSASLPPLSRAKGRRYLIQAGTNDRAAPLVLATAAQKVLQQQGATVRLETFKGGHGYAFDDPGADPIGEAIAWLEGARK
ncbi:MAG TPA: hypothetical protein VKT77_08160 [Chthonomonadaceae bacterium]|nr:hypothetical protein [Chthonomonadaceae bacterium]